ncbi:MAG: DUF2993 domain-containing protein [Corynebacterium sp.]|nr:DUF2993 domain-containing protein [Corynebacterium sp.]
MAQKNSAGTTAWKVIVSVLVTLLILLFIVEFGARWFTAKQMTDEYRAQAAADGIEATKDPEISFGPTPLIFGLVRGEIPHVAMDMPSTLKIQDQQILGQPETRIAMDNMTMSEDPVARDFAATTVIPDEFLLVTFQNAIAEQSGNRQLGNLVVTDITTSEEEGALNFQLGKGLATVTLVPSAANGQIELAAINSTLFGIQLPDEATAALSDALRDGISNDFTGNLDVEDITVGQGALSVTVSGHNVRFNELSKQLDDAPVRN